MARRTVDAPGAGRSLPVRNCLKALRLQRGLTQKELARAAGVTRQTISHIEAGLYVPSVAVAIRLARALACRVEDLFSPDEGYGELEAVSAQGLPPGRSVPLALARVGPRWVAHPLAGPDALQGELAPADGLGEALAGGDRVRVQLLDELEALPSTVVLAGCAPALPVWGKEAERRYPGLRVLWRYANSEEALRRLARGEVHVAGVHLYDPATDECNLPFVRRLLGAQEAVVITLGTWEEGLVVRAGNPLALHRAADLVRPGVRVVNREPGSGARALLEAALREEGVPPEASGGFFERVVRSHQEVARAVALGDADAGVSSRGVAALFGLDFVPWRQVRYDLVVPKGYLHDPPVRQLLATLADRRVRWQLRVMGGYDTRQTGDVVAELTSAAGS